MGGSVQAYMCNVREYYLLPSFFIPFGTGAFRIWKKDEAGRFIYGLVFTAYVTAQLRVPSILEIAIPSYSIMLLLSKPLLELNVLLHCAFDVF